MSGPAGGRVGAAVLALVLAAAAFGPLLTPCDPDRADFAAALAPPSAAHWLGADDLGHDVAARLLAGGRVSLLVAGASVAGGLLAGVPLGLASGLCGGWPERLTLHAIDALLAAPAALLALAVTAVLGASATHAAYAIALAQAPVFARIAHAQARRLRDAAFVAAARGYGAGLADILWRCVAPNALPALLAQATTLFAAAMLTESYLSFLGLGVQPPTASWGGMVRDGIGLLDRAPFLPWYPSAALSVTVLACTLLGDALRDRLDPTLETPP